VRTGREWAFRSGRSNCKFLPSKSLTICSAAKFASEAHNTALRSDIDRLGVEVGELLQFLRGQVFVDASLAHLANCVKSALDVVYSMQRLASPASSEATSPEMREIEPEPFRSQSRLLFRNPTPQPLVKKSSRRFQPSIDAPPTPGPARSQALSNANAREWDMPQRNQTYDPMLPVAKSPQPPMEYSRSPTMSPPIPRPPRSQTYDTICAAKSPERNTTEFPRRPSLSPPIPRPQRSETADTILLARSPEKTPIPYPIHSTAVSAPPQRPLRQQQSLTFQDLSSSPMVPVPKRELSESPREYLEPTHDYRDSVRDFKDTRHEFAQPKRAQPPQSKSPQTAYSDSKPSRSYTLSSPLPATTAPTPFTTTSDSNPPWSLSPPLSLDKFAEDPKSSSALDLEDYVINYLNKNLLNDSASEISKLDVQSPRGTVIQPTPPPAPIPQRPVVVPEVVPVQQRATPDTEIIQRWRRSGSRCFATGDYGRAQALLEQVVKGSEQMFGSEYEWKAETKSLLAETCVRLGRWDEAGKVLSERYDGRDAQIDGIAHGFLRDRQWDRLTWILRQQFEGRENVMEAASRAFILDQKWAEAKEMLVGLMEYKTEDNPRGLERMYLLAEVCWSRKDLGDAKQICTTAIESPKTILQKSDPLYSQFVQLAVQICHAQTDGAEADKFTSLLSSGVAGIPSNQLRLI